MRFVKNFVVIGLCLSCLHSVVSLSICQQYGEDVVLHTSYKDGNRSCCRLVLCPPGFEAVMCSPTDPLSTLCQPCPLNTFQSDPTSSVDMKYCDAKRTCDDGMKVEDDQSTVKDRRCLCGVEKGLCNPSRNRSAFCQKRSCPVGMELQQDCSCTECLDGFFKDVNGSMPCWPWRNCRSESRIRVAGGSTTTDVVCSNNTYSKERLALEPSASASTPLFSTSDMPAGNSRESHQNSSNLDQTTLQNETSHNWIAIVAGILGVLMVVAVFVLIFLCIKYGLVKNIFACCRKVPPVKRSENTEADRMPLQPIGQSTENTEAERMPLQPNGQIVAAQNGEVPREQLLNLGNPDHEDLQNENRKGDVAAAVRQPPEQVEGPLMTRAMKQNLQNSQVYLVNSLRVDAEFLSVLCTNNTITDGMKEQIKNETTSSSRNDKFVEFLLKRPSMSYKTFIFALVYTNQSNLADHIDAEFSHECKVLLETVDSVPDIVRSFGCL